MTLSIRIALLLGLGVLCGCHRDTPPPPDKPLAQSKKTTTDESPFTAHSLPPPRLPESHIKADVRLSRDKIRDVFIDGRNVTQFSRPQHVYEARVSPNDQYLLVWHMDYSPRKVSIYDLDSRRKVSTFKPGAGGSFGWAANSLLYHQYGAGTNTAIFAVYSVDGKKLWSGNSSGASLCESGRYVFVCPSLPVAKEDIQILDARNGKVLARARPSPSFLVMRGVVWQVFAHKWVSEKADYALKINLILS